MSLNILRVDASARVTGSVSRDLNDQIVSRFTETDDVTVTTRDLRNALPQIDETWIAANFTPAGARSADQSETLALSDTLIGELKAADVLLIGLPVYNFGVPTALKAWIDLVARAGVTFAYTDAGPKGLLQGKRAIVTVASGGTEMGSEYDFATGYMHHVLGFLGITDVVFVAADRMAINAEDTLKSARAAIDALDIAA